MAVTYVRPEVQSQLSKWNLIRDCLAGQEAIKKAGDRYLPRPNASDSSQENADRYKSYLARAVFYNVTKRTLDGLVGQVFTREPVVQLPSSLEMLETDLDGGGVGINQQGKKALSEVMAYGRCGLLVDYPPTEQPASRADQESGYVRPTVAFYDPWNIINWRVLTKGARQLLSLVVLQEVYVEEDDGFETKTGTQWRVLRLVGGVDEAGNPVQDGRLIYRVEVYREDAGADPVEIYEPKDSTGANLQEIPFTFIGSLNNDPNVDQPPLYDLAELNVAHYRNSADYEEACFLVGQPTPWFSGLTQQWVDDNFKGGVQLGSRRAVPLPEGGTAGLLQAQQNSMTKEAMELKERQMVALGAKLVEQKQVQRTLGEAELEEASETSVLSTAAKNVSAAYTQAITWAMLFTGESAEPLYELSSDYPASRMSAQERQELISEWQSGAISFTEMRTQLRKAGIAYLEDEDAKDEIAANPPTPAIGGVPGMNGDPNNPDNPDNQNNQDNPPPKA